MRIRSRQIAAVVVLMLFFGCFGLHAARLEGTLTAGASYDSNPQYLYLLEKVVHPDWEKKQTLFVKTDAEFSLFPIKNRDILSFDFSVLSSTAIPDLSISRLNLYGSVYFAPELSDTWSMITIFRAHHFMEDYNNPEQMYLDVYLSLLFVWFPRDDMAFSFATDGSYFHSFSSRIPELNGPTVSETLSYSYYLDKEGSEMSLSAGFGYYHFKDYDEITHCDNRYHIVNRYISFPAEFRVRWKKSFFSTGFSFAYSYNYWLDWDYWTIAAGPFKKRRKDHTVTAAPFLAFDLPENFVITLRYVLDDTLSNMGSHKNDYVDYRVEEHTVSLEVAWNFSVGE